MDAALDVCSRRGLQQSSIDEIAREAGFTKGAFYANFASKEDLLLALLDAHFAERIAAIEETAGTEDSARRAADAFGSFVRSNPAWNRLFFEFAAHAARDDAFRAELLLRYRRLRDSIAEAVRVQAAALGVDPPLAPDRIALMIFAAGNGAGLEWMLEPDETPDDLFTAMLERIVAT